MLIKWRRPEQKCWLKIIFSDGKDVAHVRPTYGSCAAKLRPIYASSFLISLIDFAILPSILMKNLAKEL